MGRTIAGVVGWFAFLSASALAADPPRTLDLHVIDRETGSAVAGASVRWGKDRAGRPTASGTTDEQGRCLVPVVIDRRFGNHFSVYVIKEGHVPVRIHWGYGRIFQIEGVPASYTVTLDRGETIGGVVRDEQGRPIAGARVFPSFDDAKRGEVEWYALPFDFSVVTDAEGRWRCPILPGTLKADRLSFRVEHPKFLGENGPRGRSLAVRDLRAGTAAIVMRRGYTLAGTVVDERGRPIEGATVTWRPAYDEAHDERVKTAADGRFRFEGRPEGLATVAAEAPGLAMAARLVELGPHGPVHDAPAPIEGQSEEESAPAARPDAFAIDARQAGREGPCDPPLTIRLGPGRAIRGRVVDANGRPVVGARITPDLRGNDGLPAWRGTTDDDGRFRWDHAPTEDLVLDVDHAEGHRHAWRRPPAAGGELVITVPVAFRLSGTVVDAETGRPIERFRIIRGSVYEDFTEEDSGRLKTYWEPATDRTITEGRYEMGFGSTKQIWGEPIRVVRVEAEGYAPQTSRQYRSEEGEQTWNVRLHKHSWIIGTVRAPDGSPLQGAEVVIAARGGPSPYFDNGRLQSERGTNVVCSGADGRYAFARPDTGGRVVFVADRGMAQRTVAELATVPNVTLEPWGRIQGVLRVGGLPGARRIVGADVNEPDDRGKPVALFTSRALTAAEGRFVLEHVAPGRALVYRPTWRGASMFRSHRQGVDVSAGRTAEALIGGTGRAVVGRLLPVEGMSADELRSVSARLWLLQENPEFPEGFVDWDEERRNAWWYAFYETEAGRRYLEAGASYAVEIGPDGSFRLDDVPAGEYRLDCFYTKTTGGFDQPQETRRAELNLDVEIPAEPAGEPFDLGALKLPKPVVDR